MSSKSTTRDKILLAFAARPGCTLSGEALSKAIGVSRTSVWKHIDALKKEGLPLEGAGRTGYRFKQAFDLSLYKRAQAKNGGWSLHYVFETASTQALAKQAAEKGEPGGQIWAAERQTGGHGRLDRKWESPMGGLWFSVLLRPSLAPTQTPPLALLAGLRLSEAIEDVAGVRAKLKWPNDLLVQTPGGWRKLAGILTEMSGEMDRTRWLVLGVGVNVFNTIPAPVRDVAVSLQPLSSRTFTRADLLGCFLERFEPAYQRFQKEGFEPFAASYWQRYSRPDEDVRVQTARGPVTGKARSVDGLGALVVESYSGLVHLSEGEIIS